MSTLTKRVESLESAADDMPPDVVLNLRQLLGITGHVEPGWLAKVPTADLVRAFEQLNAEKGKA